MNTAPVCCILIFGLLPPPLCNASAQDSLKKGKEALEKLDAKGAITHLTEAIRKDPKNTEAYYHRGKAYRSDTQFDKALVDFNVAIQLNPKFADAYYERGTLQDDKQKAIVDLSEAIRLAPNHVAARTARAIIYYDLKEYAKAIVDCQEAIQLEPRHSIPYFTLAKVLAACPEAKFRDGKKAVEYARKACELTKWEDHQSLEALAAANAELGNFDEAIKCQKKAVEILSSIGIDREGAKERIKLYEEKKPLRIYSYVEWVM